jgi:hypothetical protein
MYCTFNNTILITVCQMHTGYISCNLLYYIQGIHKRMVRFQYKCLLKPHHSFGYALYIT